MVMMTTEDAKQWPTLTASYLGWSGKVEVDAWVSFM